VVFVIDDVYKPKRRVLFLYKRKLL